MYVYHGHNFFFLQRLHKRFYIEKAKRGRKKEIPHVTPKVRVCRETGWGPFCFYFRNMHLLLFFGTCAVSVWCVWCVLGCVPLWTCTYRVYRTLPLLIFRLCGWMSFCGTGTMTLVSLPMLSQSRDARGRSLARSLWPPSNEKTPIDPPSSFSGRAPDSPTTTTTTTPNLQLIHHKHNAPETIKKNNWEYLSTTTTQTSFLRLPSDHQFYFWERVRVRK